MRAMFVKAIVYDLTPLPRVIRHYYAVTACLPACLFTPILRPPSSACSPVTVICRSSTPFAAQLSAICHAYAMTGSCFMMPLLFIIIVTPRL